MPDQTHATILLAGRRLKKQTGDQFRSLSSIHQKVTTFGQLVLFADETLAPGSTAKIQTQAATTILLLPLAGEINFQTAPGQESALPPGQAAWLTAGLENQPLVANSYATEYVNYLQIRFSNAVSFRQNQLQQAAFDLDRPINQLSRLQVPGHLPIHIGKFSGRQEGSFVPDTASVFVFVIEGAFEVQNRLLETRDALMLKGAGVVEFEALSNNAILLILEAG